MDLPPIPKEMTQVLMERELLLVTDAERRPVTLRIGMPVQDVKTVDGFAWRCPVEFVGLTKTRPFSAVGVDALQALTLALFAARARAEAWERETGGHFSWLGEPGHGLPSIDLATA
jgi:hypothetical protein